jgi:O-antigen/teichoic acid export membrane protein
MSGLGAYRRNAARRASWGIADQALLSATNFLTMVLIARGLTPTKFGAFTLVYTMLLLANGLQGALVTQPHNVLGVALHGSRYRRYTSSTALMHVAVTVPVAAAIAMAAVAGHLAGWSASPLVVALLPAAVAWMAQELVRRVLYTEGRLRAAFLNDSISYGGQTVAIVGLWSTGSLTAPLALYALAATSAAAVLFGLWQLRRSFGRESSWADVRENWHFGKWLAAAFAAYCCSSQLYLFLSAALLGTAATGTVKAALVVMGPLNVLLVFIDTTVPSVLARALHAGGERALRTEFRLTIAVAAPIVGAYCVLAAVFSGSLLHLFYGRRYEGATLALTLFALHYFVLFVTRTFGAAVRALRNTRAVFNAHLVAALVAVTSGWAIIREGGVDGVALGMVLSSSIVCAILLWAYLAGLGRSVVKAPPSPVVSRGGSR